jgi:hypothetical protein
LTPISIVGAAMKFNSCRPGPRLRFTQVALRWVLPALVMATAAPIRAEVSVVTDSKGRAVRTLVLNEVRGGRRLYWSRVRHDVDARTLLNVRGDQLGDDAPLVREQPGSRQPWVVWSASDGHDKEIAFATWKQGSWQGPQLVDRVDNPYDDLNPRLAFDAKGTPIVTWWRNEPIPKVYLSIYVHDGWSRPITVSDPTVAGRYPSVRVDRGRAVVTFYTPRGQTVLFQELVAPDNQSSSEAPPLDGPNPPPEILLDPPQDTDNCDQACETNNHRVPTRKQ